MIIDWISLIRFHWKGNLTIFNLCLVFEINLMWKPNNPTTNSEIPGAKNNSGLLDEFPGRNVVAFRDSSLPSSSSLPPTFLLSLWQTGRGKGKRGGRVEGRRQTTVGRLKAPVREKEQRPGMSGRSRTVKTQQRAALLFWLENPCFDFL